MRRGLSYLILLVHLVELVNAAYAVIGEHKRPCLDAKLPRLRILHHRCGETRGAAGLAGRVDGARHE